MFDYESEPTVNCTPHVDASADEAGPTSVNTCDLIANKTLDPHAKSDWTIDASSFLMRKRSSDVVNSKDVAK